MTYFFQIFPDTERPGAEMARVVDAERSLIWNLLRDEPWPPDRATPRWRLPSADPTDLVDVVTGFLAFSGRVREVLDKYSDPGSIDWRGVHIEDRHGQAHDYWAFHWAGPPIPLNLQHSTFGPGGPIREVFLRSAVDHLHVFGVATGLLTLVVSDVVWQRLRDIGATGMTVEPALIA